MKKEDGLTYLVLIMIWCSIFTLIAHIWQAIELFRNGTISPSVADTVIDAVWATLLTINIRNAIRNWYMQSSNDKPSDHAGHRDTIIKEKER